MTSSTPVTRQAPVTPPPENMAFPKMPGFSEHDEPFSMKAFQDPSFQNAQLKFQQAQMLGHRWQQEHQQPRSPPASSHIPHQPSATPFGSSQPTPQPPQQQHPSRASPHLPFGPAVTGQSPMSPSADAGAAASLDPKYLAMVSRIAAYYQQRCQAVANYQQQRCQAWATMHRQKCQEMVQAAMLVVAWYIRDRIQRRRRRQKRNFRKGLGERTSRSKVTKGEVVRRWVLQVPESAPSPNETHQQRLVDREEAEFSMDREVPPDKDTKLFSVADNLIKSQLSKIEVPLMGALSFDESESESDGMEAGEEEEEEEEAEDVGRVDDGCENIYEQDLGAHKGRSEGEFCNEDDDDDDDDDMSLDDCDDDELGSDLVQNGTGEGSRAGESSSAS